MHVQPCRSSTKLTWKRCTAVVWSWCVRCVIGRVRKEGGGGG
jgi:hypothetical protein